MRAHLLAKQKAHSRCAVPASMINHKAQLKVCFLITGLFAGGAERQVVELALRLKRRGRDVVVNSMLPGGVLDGELTAAGIPVVSLDMRRGVADPRALLRFARLLKAQAPDILHSHMVHANILARCARWMCDIPVLVCTVHSVNEGSKWREIAYRYTDWLADITTTVCRAAAERYVRVGNAPKGRLIVLENGVDTKRYAPYSGLRTRIREELSISNEFVWLAVGRLDAVKNYPAMIRSFASVAPNESALLIAGEGPLRGVLEELICALNLERRVRLLGLRRDVPDLMNAADAFVMSSLWEGMPMALLEASACELPIVATNVGGTAEVVQDERTGFLVTTDSPDQLGETMAKLMTLSQFERQSIGRTGRQFVLTHFDMETVVDRWESLYLALSSNRQSDLALQTEPRHTNSDVRPGG